MTNPKPCNHTDQAITAFQLFTVWINEQGDVTGACFISAVYYIQLSKLWGLWTTGPSEHTEPLTQ